jgi:hypothetical protein
MAAGLIESRGLAAFPPPSDRPSIIYGTKGPWGLLNLSHAGHPERQRSYTCACGRGKATMSTTAIAPTPHDVAEQRRRLEVKLLEKMAEAIDNEARSATILALAEAFAWVSVPGQPHGSSSSVTTK